MAIEECPKFPVSWTEGDELPEILGVLEDVDITGYTITLTLQRPTDVLTKTAVITDATSGGFKFTWDNTDLVAGVNQLAVIQFANALGEKLTPDRFLIDVLELPA